MTSATQRSLDQAAARAPRPMLEAVTDALRAGTDPARASLLARSIRAVTEWVSALDERSVGEAVAAPADYEALLRALSDSAALDLVRGQDPLAPARVRGLERRLQLVNAEGGAIAAPEVARLIGISRQAVDKRRRTGKLIGVSMGRRGYLYPSWQLGPAGTLPGLETVLAHLADHDPLMQVAFMLNTNTWLDGESPLSALRQGRLEAVLEAAHAYGEHGAA